MSSDVERLRKLNRLLDVLPRTGRMRIVLQDNPDPDALASAAALKLLAHRLSGSASDIVFGGLVGRAENRALVRYLGLNVVCTGSLKFKDDDFVAMVDTQPGAGNNCLPDGLLPKAVIDHHPLQEMSRSVSFTDIRSNYGATSTILTEYIRLSDIEMEARLATGLIYGIKSDTQDLGREATKADIDAYLFLYPMANKRQLARIEREPVPPSYFHELLNALRRAYVYRTCVISSAGLTQTPDTAAELADLLIRLQGVEWALCVAFCNRVAYLSLRCVRADGDAGEVIRKIVGADGKAGGHDSYAGGQIPVADDTSAERSKWMKRLTRRTLKVLGLKSEWKRALRSLKPQEKSDSQGR